jgi:hypothetical protein
MEATDPATGRPLPADAIQRILFIATGVHVYNIPPLTSTKGYTAASWTEDPKRQIFTCRLRVVETAIPQDDGDDQVKIDLVLEDASSGQLFAAAPYITPAVVEPALDSSRFFAVRVQDGAGRKATLGIGYEERSIAFDFSIALQEARKALGLDGPAPGAGGQGSDEQAKAEEKKDYSLKEGETITINLGGTRVGRRARPQDQSSSSETANLSSFALPPPPSASHSSSSSRNSFLPPPPSAQEVRAQKRLSAQELGFDDGQFGEFA